MALLDEDEIATLLADHPLWRRRGRTLERELEFKELADAGRFVARASAQLPPRDPYPEFLLHGFKSVTVRIGHGNAAGMSVADVRLVEALDEIIAAPADVAITAAPAAAPAPRPDQVLSAGVQDAAPGPATPPEAPQAGAGPEAATPPPTAEGPGPTTSALPPAAGAGSSLVARLISAGGLLVTGAVLGRVIAWRAARRRRGLRRRSGLLG
jgi:pterin-4a-carbinolamine dehydratase